MDKNIYVTRPYLPPLKDFIPYLEQIWKNKQLTNMGPFHKDFEKALSTYLEVDHISLFTNGTLALVTALQSLKITGEVITTPYSFVATSHALLWNGITPVFVDIDPISLNIDPNRIEEAITPQTTAILPVHIYGHPCDVDTIQNIADIYGLKVIYDAAHAFGVKHASKNIFKFGDLSILSFHATKVFTTFEGGAIICPDAITKKRIDYLKNFGFAGETTVAAPGLNGKMNEFQAALGLIQLKHFDRAIKLRKKIYEKYRNGLKNINGIRLLPAPEKYQWNYCYFPVLIDPSYPMSRDALYQKLREFGIYVRRYFYPLISEFPMYRGLPSANSEQLQVAKSISRQILCLPIYPDLEMNMVYKIIEQISSIG
jgi:dTDP-4-amino-4,6-dideoxygalactose transaminase